MLSRLEIRGLGPHEHTRLTFDAAGCTELVAPSEAGKSTALDALCFALWGCGAYGRPLPVEQIRDGAERVEVVATMISGTAIRRTMTRGRSIQRSIRREGAERAYTREDELRADLGVLGAQAEVARIVMVPLSWVELAQGPGGGRPLRDLLAHVLPEVDIAAIVAGLMRDAGHAYRDGDPLAEERAVEVRRRAHEERARARGRVEALDVLAAKLGAEEIAAPTEDALRAWREALASAAAWREHDLSERTHLAASERHQRDGAALEAWRARRAELSERPTSESTARTALAARLAELRDDEAEQRAQAGSAAEVHRRGAHALEHAADATPAEHASLERYRSVVRQQVATRRAIDQQLEALERAGTTCPTCGRDGWASANETARQHDLGIAAAAAAEKAERDLVREEATVTAAGHARHETAVAADREAVSALRSARDRTAAAEARLEAARHELAAIGPDAGAAWDQRLRALGPEPAITPGPGAPPVPPSTPRPSDSDRDQAQLALADAERRKGAAEQRVRDTAETASTLATAREGLADLEAECVRLEALVDAVRRAPSIAAAQQLSAFGDLGPVAIAFPLTGEAIAITFDGRPWWLASTGRQIVCDAWLRAGLRRAVGLPWLPIWVDRVQDVVGQELPALEGPAVLLRTADGALGTAEVRGLRV